MNFTNTSNGQTTRVWTDLLSQMLPGRSRSPHSCRALLLQRPDWLLTPDSPHHPSPGCNPEHPSQQIRPVGCQGKHHM
ncbi:hypothetical protein BDV10DRAFT_11702 [Aspergillus recurvatus]